jgi:membrane-anchored glycerophosphoryl diester phosphodiesterase (GDPDase)
MATTLDLTGTVRYAFQQIATRTGALLVAAYVLVQLLTQVTVQSAAARFTAARLPADVGGQLYPLAVDMPLALSGGLSVLLILVGLVLGILTMRAFYRDVEDFPTADHTRRIVRTAVVTVVVSLIVFVAVAVGSVFLFVPGIFLAVSLVFAVLAVAVEDAGVVEALKRSWSLTSGNRIRLFVLGFAFVVLSGAVGVVISVTGFVAPAVGDVGGAVVNGVISVFGVALLVGAYRQLASADAAADGREYETTAL